MKSNWFKSYKLLNIKRPSRQFQSNVRNSVLMSINQDRMEGSNNMNIKKPVKWLSIAIAIALLGTVSVIGVDASTDGAISNKIRLFINDKPVDNVNYISSGENDDGSYYYQIEIGDSDTLNTDDLEVSLTVTLGCNNHLEKDENNRLWIKCDDDTLSVDITDELNETGTYTYFSTDDNGNMLCNVITGTADNYIVESNPIEECSIETEKEVETQAKEFPTNVITDGDRLTYQNGVAIMKMGYTVDENGNRVQMDDLKIIVPNIKDGKYYLQNGNGYLEITDGQYFQLVGLDDDIINKIDYHYKNNMDINNIYDHQFIDEVVNNKAYFWINPIWKESDYDKDIDPTALDNRTTHIELTHQLSGLDDCTWFPLYYFQKDGKDILLFDGDLFFNGETQLDDLVFILEED